MNEQPDTNSAADPQTSEDAELQKELEAALGDQSIDEMMEQSVADREAESKAEADEAAKGKEGKADADAAHGPTDLKRGRISAVSDDEVFVEFAGIDARMQGVVPLAQFERKPRVGSIMDFVVERVDESEGVVHLSREGAIGAATWDTLARGATVEARVVGTNKGGLELELPGSINAFMPASQVEMFHVEDLSEFVGQKIPAVVIELKRHDKKIVLSRREYLMKQREAAKRKLWAEIEEGQIREGLVSNVMDYGAFVDLGGVDGLVHVSDMAYTRVDKPEQVVKPGDKVKVKVLKIDPEKQRISLGLKQVQPDPWEGIAARYNPGDTISGRVTRLAQFGAFIEVEPGVEGLLPVSEMSFKRIGKPSDVVSEGDVIKIAVMQIDEPKRRMSLSIKGAGEDPWVGAEHKYARGTVCRGRVLSTTDFGAFVELEPAVEGLVHISELDHSHVKQVTDVLSVGQEEDFKVLEVDEEQRRIKLSLKAAKDAPEHMQQQPEQDRRSRKQKSKFKKPGNLNGGLGDAGGLGTGLGNIKL